MWCGECYISHAHPKFHVQTKEQFMKSLPAEDRDRLIEAWGKKHQEKTNYGHARDGDHLMVPFECDVCIFWKLRGCGPSIRVVEDLRLMSAIRRINLDAFWSRATATVHANRNVVRNTLKVRHSVGLKGPYRHTQAMPSFDHCGYETAIAMVLYSLREGKNDKDYLQWDTIRKIRTGMSNHSRTAPQQNARVLAMSDERGHASRLVEDNTSSYWFSRFFAGCKRRMGQDWRPNKAMDIALMLAVIQKIKERSVNSDSQLQSQWIVFGTYLVITYVLSLRGSEGLLVDLAGLIEYHTGSQLDYVVITLLGKVKGEHHDRYHLLPCVQKTSSGINVKDWLTNLIQHKQGLGFVDGPAISDDNGVVLTTGSLDELFIDILEEIFDDERHLFPPSIKVKEDISNSYMVYRSPRRSSDTRAVEQNVSKSDVDIVNRWHTIEQAKGNVPHMQMQQRYAQVELLLKPYLRYTAAM